MEKVLPQHPLLHEPCIRNMPMGFPLYRQEKDWKQYGVQIRRITLANWIICCSQNYFQPMYDYFHRELLKRSLVMADETRVQVLNEDGLPAIILYGYSQTRSGSHARKFLKGYSGYLETDGYQGYNNLPGIRRCSCWAYIRRYFIDAASRGKQYDYSQKTNYWLLNSRILVF